MKQLHQSTIKPLSTHIGFILITFILLLPLIYMLSTAFRPNQAILAPLIQFSSWTDASIADNQENSLSQKKICRNFSKNFDIINFEVADNKKELKTSLLKLLKKKLKAKGKMDQKIKSQYLTIAENYQPHISTQLIALLYDHNTQEKFIYSKRFTLKHFVFFFTGKYEGENSWNYPVKTWFLNSLYIATTVTIIQVLIVTLAAYAISRYRFSGRGAFVTLVVILQIFPASMMMIAFYLLLDYIGQFVPSLGLNSIHGLIMLYLGIGIPLNIWLSKSYMESLPESIEESAMIDGASYPQIFWLIIIPLIRPIMVVVAMLSFIAAYNEFLLATFIITSPENLTLPVGLSFFMDGEIVKFSTFSAIAVIGSLPVLIIWQFFQKYLIAGLTQSSVKE